MKEWFQNIKLSLPFLDVALAYKTDTIFRRNLVTVVSFWKQRAKIFVFLGLRSNDPELSGPCAVNKMRSGLDLPVQCSGFVYKILK